MIRRAAVRRALCGDVAALLELCAEHAAFERAFYRAEGKADRLSAALTGDPPRLRAWIATVGEDVVGYATATEEFSTWDAAPFLSMDCLFVRPPHRGGGIGAALLGAVIAAAREGCLAEVRWQTPAWNTDASRFYRRHDAVARDKTSFSLALRSGDGQGRGRQ